VRLFVAAPEGSLWIRRLTGEGGEGGEVEVEGKKGKIRAS
jgi:hypothetical protein